MLPPEDRYLKMKYMLAFDNTSNRQSYEYPRKEDRNYAIPRWSAY